MKYIPWIVGVVVLVAIIIGGFYLYSPQQETQQPKGEDWAVELNTGADAMLFAECADDEYIENDANYILDIKINEIDLVGDKKEYSLDIVGWLKGKPSIVPSSLTITTPAALSSEDPVFEEGKDYRINLKKVNDNLVFVCGFRGVKEMTRYDDLP